MDADTRRRIDTARDILVGKVPDPKSQVEQITIALIYKFMDDIDAESEELGGERTFFAGEFERYGWSKLMRSGLGGTEMLLLYAEAIQRMPENPGIPPLFRDIFNNAYLPYRDPETLRAFLRVIDEFTYDHSERLGDAFEYLLSVLGSQGDAGQFRTPRHIIDFIVRIVDPKKDERILDPACGTAGFLISSYKHILAANTNEQGQSTLTGDERAKMVQNFVGYDISPDMVRLSLVNMFLHKFPEPHVYEYDTLTQEDRWNERFDVILANPPFMSPKGGIRPHNKFSIPAKRSEVLFVDYIAEHLRPNGRAGIIVPEGIIFQSQTAYRDLRRMLVEQYLVAVISLPAGVFNPYSGVKTSILILDPALAKQSETIAFFKVENDGFSLGAQRRPVSANDLPSVQKKLGGYLVAISHPEERLDVLPPSEGVIIERTVIATNSDYNLSGERYKSASSRSTSFPWVRVGEICLDIQAGFASGKSCEDTSGVPQIRPMNIDPNGRFTLQGVKYLPQSELRGRESYYLRPGDVLFNNTNSVELVGKTGIVEQELQAVFSNHMTRIRTDDTKCLPKFLATTLHYAWQTGAFAELATRWVGQAGINTSALAEFEFPLPPLEAQREIVAEIEGYQKVIDGARQVVEYYRPHIPIDPEWPLVPLGEYFKTVSGGTPSKANAAFWAGSIPWVSPKDMKVDRITDTEDHISEAAITQSATKLLPAGTVVAVVRSGILKHSFPVAVLERTMAINQDLVGFVPLADGLQSEFLCFWLRTQEASILVDGIKPGVTVQSFHSGFFDALLVPLPPVNEQDFIVRQLQEAEKFRAGTTSLAVLSQDRVDRLINDLWGGGAR